MRVDGKLVYLDSIKNEDLKKIVDWKNDKDLSYLILSDYKPVTIIEVTEWCAVNSADANQVLFGIYSKDSNGIIGISRLMYIDRVSRHAEFGIYIGDRSQQSQGLGTEAIKLSFNYGFENLNLHKIYLKVSESNIPAIKAYKRVGMEQEGLLKEHILISDAYQNIALYGILKSNFRL